MLGGMSMHLVVFLSVMLPAIAGVVTHVVRRASWAARLGPRARGAASALALAAILAPVIARAGGTTVANLAGGIAVQIGFGVALATLIAFVLLLPLELAWGLGALRARWQAREARSDSPKGSEGSETKPEEPVSRRVAIERLAIGAALATGASTSIYGTALGRHDYVLEDVPIPLRGLPRTLDGYTVVQLSDLHVGTFVGEYELAAAVDLSRRARPDLIVLTGDLVDFDPRYAELLGRFARRLGSIGARDGVVAIPGNHDYYAGVDQVLGSLRRAGVEVLRNGGKSIGDRGGSFALLGVDDVWAERNGYAGRTDLRAALRALGEDGERDRARVLLCHNPEYFPEAAPHVDLQLSGHTHGGQVNMLVRPADLVLRHGYVAGHYFRGDAQIYVNRGFGTAGPPARIGAPPEVSRIVLSSA